MKPLKILIIDDEQLIRWSFEKKFSNQETLIYTSDTGEEGINLFKTYFPDIVFIDNRLPGIQGLEVIEKLRTMNEDAILVFMTAYGSIDVAVNAIKLGASEYISKPFNFKEIQTLLENIKQKISTRNEIQLLRRQQKDIVTFDHIIGESPTMKKIIQEAKKISRYETTTVLLLGESGTGKDQFARAIHYESARRAKPFVTINCSSLPENLLESELFGYEQGAFTDARKLKKGLFEMAEGGTIFLDEIGEINPSIQVKLLGVIENRKIKRVGGTIDIPVEIRIVAATNKDLNVSMKEKLFREDLYYRLKVFQITMPPLRDHIEDVKPLAYHFLKQFNSQFGKNIHGIDPMATGMLQEYNWPGNIRELRNVIERGVILETTDILRKENLPGEIIDPKREDQLRRSERTTISPHAHVNIAEGVSLHEMEKQTIKRILEETGYNQSKAARLLGISRDTLRYRMKKFNL